MIPSPHEGPPDAVDDVDPVDIDPVDCDPVDIDPVDIDVELVDCEPVDCEPVDCDPVVLAPPKPPTEPNRSSVETPQPSHDAAPSASISEAVVVALGPDSERARTGPGR